MIVPDIRNQEEQSPHLAGIACLALKVSLLPFFLPLLVCLYLLARNSRRRPEFISVWFRLIMSKGATFFALNSYLPTLFVEEIYR